MENNFIRSLDQQDGSSMPVPKFIIILLLVALVGGAIGFVFSSFRSTSKSIGIGGSPVKQTAGIVDKKTFKDQAEGILREGGVDGEGNFHLERQGGASQNAYLTSSTVDLSQYIGKKVRVWGQTFKGQKAGWLMDVGLVETL